jgi:hypothetical protein
VDLIGPVALIVSVLGAGCGKEGPPLPPLVRLPAAPAGLAAERRGDIVDVQLVVPSANTDGSRPANVARVDVYAITAPASVTDDQLVKLGTLVGQVQVKAPRDPDATVEPDEPLSDAEPPEGAGIDQGSTTRVQEQLTPANLAVVDLIRGAGGDTATPSAARPLTGPALQPPSRVYAGVGVSTRGRRGPFSPRAAALLAPAPEPLQSLEATYDEKAIALSWRAVPSRLPVQEPASGGELEARFIGLVFPSTAYHVYEVKDATATRLTNPSITEAGYDDTRLEWGTERCYQVRVVHLYEKAEVESASSPAACVTPVDTFAPTPPTNVRVVPSSGAISLIWQRGAEGDLAGFIVLRAAVPSDALTPVTTEPIAETSFMDKVAAGTAYVYAIQAVDKAGNRSEPSSRSEIVEAR